MTNKLSLVTGLISLSVLLSSCEVIGAIFKTGLWTGVIIVAIIIAVVIFIARKFSSKK
ncbi:MAG TPA: phosphatidate cytidylyltransferase [Ferruginibacter sp.]|nr:phosphatidate cytidylyltransferase [Ferruginibacter sp.]HPH90384.1 phosphatidate cytidylyltransferase [Ferruginibacter sp.]